MTQPEAERRVLEALPHGRWVHFCGRNGEDAECSKVDASDGGSWGDERTLSAAFLRRLLKDKLPRRSNFRGGLRIHAARIVGSLDLNSVHPAGPIVLRDCHFDKSVTVPGETSYELDLRGSHLPGLKIAEVVDREDDEADGSKNSADRRGRRWNWKRSRRWIRKHIWQILPVLVGVPGAIVAIIILFGPSPPPPSPMSVELSATPSIVPVGETSSVSATLLQPPPGCGPVLFWGADRGELFSASTRERLAGPTPESTVVWRAPDFVGNGEIEVRAVCGEGSPSATASIVIPVVVGSHPE